MRGIKVPRDNERFLAGRHHRASLESSVVNLVKLGVPVQIHYGDTPVPLFHRDGHHVPTLHSAPVQVPLRGREGLVNEGPEVLGSADRPVVLNLYALLSRLLQKYCHRGIGFKRQSKAETGLLPTYPPAVSFPYFQI